LAVNANAGLTAIGTTAEPITFTSGVATGQENRCDWNGILIDSDAGPAVRIQHAVIEYACVGVSSSGRRGLTIADNLFRYIGVGPSEGAITGDTDNSWITRNEMDSCSNGIVLNESYDNYIISNTISDIDHHGIALIKASTTGGDRNMIEDNQIQDCGQNGVHLESGAENAVKNNTIYRSGEAGILIDQQSNTLVHTNTVLSNAWKTGARAGVLISSSANIELASNQLQDNGSDAASYVAALSIQNMDYTYNELLVNHNVISDTYGMGIDYAGNNNNSSSVMQNNAICSLPSLELANRRAGHSIDARYGWWGTNIPTMGTDPLSDAVSGEATIVPWITLSMTTAPTTVVATPGATATVQVTMNDGAAHTVPKGARDVRLTTNAGMIVPDVVTLDANGLAEGTLTLADIPAQGQVVISATAFCNYPVTTTLGLQRTNVAITKTSGVAQVIPGGTFTYVITYANTSDVTATDVTITDTLPAGVSWAGDTAVTQGWTRLATAPPTWYTPTLLPGTQVSFVLTGTLSPANDACGQFLTNQVTISTVTSERSTDDNASGASIQVICPRVTITKTGDGLSKVGDPVTYTFQILNASIPVSSPPLILDTVQDIGYGWSGLGDVTGVALANGCQTLSSGASCTFDVQHIVHSGAPDPLSDTVTVTTHPSGLPDTITDSDSHSVELFQPSVQVEKSGPLSIDFGEAINYTFTVTNTGSADSPSLILDTVEDVGDGWPGLGDLTAIAQTNGCSTLPPGAHCRFTAPYTHTTGTTGWLTNTVTVTYHPLGFTNIINAADDHTSALPGVNLFVTKHDNVEPGVPTRTATDLDRLGDPELAGQIRQALQASPRQHRPFVFEGDVVTYTITLINTGNYTATNVVLTETLPLYTQYVGYGWTPVNSRTYTLTVGTLPPSDWRIYEFVVQITDTLPSGINHVLNLVCGGSDQPDLDPSENCRYESTPVRRRALRVSKSAESCIAPGDAFNYTITYANVTTGTTFSNVPLTDTLDPYVDYIGGSEWQCNGQVCTRTIPTIPPDVSGTLRLPVRLRASFPYTIRTVLTNTVVISGGHRFVLVTPVDTGPNLAVVKNDNVGPVPPGAPMQREFVNPGELITYTILYVNGGVGPATGVVLTETLPQHTTFVGDSSWQDAGGGLYTQTVGDLGPRSGYWTYFIVRVDDPLPSDVYWVLNQVEIGSATAECDLSNNRSFEQTPISNTVPPSWTLSKSGPSIAYPNSVITYTIVTVNNGPSEPGVTLSDPLPNNTLYKPGSCTYRVNGGASQPCDTNYPNEPSYVMWQQDIAADARITTTFAVTVQYSSMDWQIENCATFNWADGQIIDCARTLISAPTLIKTAPSSAYSNEMINYTIITENDTGLPMPQATLSDTVPYGTVFVLGSCTYNKNASPPQTCDALPVMWQEDLGIGDRITTTFSVIMMITSPTDSPVVNRADLNWNGFQISAYATTTLSFAPTLTKYAPATAQTGERITYTIVTVNDTLGPIYGVILSDVLPDGVTPPVPGSCTYTDSQRQVCNAFPELWQADLAPGDRITTTFAVTVTEKTINQQLVNCATARWGDSEVQDCATTTVIRGDVKIYVANRDSGTLDVFNLDTLELFTSTVQVGADPFGMATDGKWLFVADFDERADAGTLQILNAMTGTLVTSYTVGGHPIHITHYDGHVYVSSHSSPPAITVIDIAGGRIAAQPILNRLHTDEFGFFGATTDERRGRVYLGKMDYGSIGIWSLTPPSPGEEWVPQWVYHLDETYREKPSSILYHPTTDRVYVTFGLIDELWILDPATWTRLEKIRTGHQDPVGPGYGGHGLAALGQCVFVSNYLDQSITAVVDGSCVENWKPKASSTNTPYKVYLPLVGRQFMPSEPSRIVTIPLSGRPKGMTAGAGHLLFVTLAEDGNGEPWNRVAVIDTYTLNVIDEFSVAGDHPHTIILWEETLNSSTTGSLILP